VPQKKKTGLRAKLLAREPINVALIGYGFAGKTFHAPLISATEGLCLACIASSDPLRVAKDWPKVEVLAYNEVFERPEVDLIVVATPNTTHFDLAKKALSSGKHLVVDKPFTTTVSEAKHLIALAKQQKHLLSVFQSRRWDADFLTLRRLLSQGRLGEVMYFESRYDRFRPEVKTRWRELPGPASGIWYDLGAHLVDQVLQLFGMPDGVYADLAMQRPGAKAVDYFHVLLRYGSKRVVLNSSSLVVASGPRFFVHGTHGSYVKDGMDTQESALKNGKKPGGMGWGKDPVQGTLSIPRKEKILHATIPNRRGNYLAYYRAVRDAIWTGAPNPVPAEEALDVMRVLELAVRSSEQKCELPVK
jgi:predicted dehydrogenase